MKKWAFICLALVACSSGNGKVEQLQEVVEDLVEKEVVEAPLPPDADGDGISDSDDNCPEVANQNQSNNDGDARGDLCDEDDDNDGVSDSQEQLHGSDPFKSDSDGDGLTDDKEIASLALAKSLQMSPIKEDSDGDGFKDPDDFFPGDPLEWLDQDKDSIGDNADNCPSISNKGQEDLDSDGQGDLCDADLDGDGLENNQELEKGTNPRLSDSDADGLLDGEDGCPLNSDLSFFDLTELNKVIDQDEDGFSPACDCNDQDSLIHPNAQDSIDVDYENLDGVDTNCDGVDGFLKETLFLSQINGDDAGEGSLEKPFKSLAQAFSKISEEKKIIYVAAGDYSVDEVSWEKGALIYGGFSNSLGDAFKKRKVRVDLDEFKTSLNSSHPEKGLFLKNVESKVEINGFHISNNIEVGSKYQSNTITVESAKGPIYFSNNIIAGGVGASRVMALDVNAASFLQITDNKINGGNGDWLSAALYLDSVEKGVIKNNVIIAGDAPYVIGLSLTKSQVTIDHNTIDATNRFTEPGVVTSSYGMLLEEVPWFLFTNNFLWTDLAQNQYPVSCQRASSLVEEGSSFSNNWVTAFPQDQEFPLIVSCQGVFQTDLSDEFVIKNVSNESNQSYQASSAVSDVVNLDDYAVSLNDVGATW